ncbi:MAG: hypothetical protein WC431_00410 [Candidatus Omnitrophota bacterium]|jgi:hypothetical protein
MEWWEKLETFFNVKVLYPILRKLSKIFTAEIEAEFFKEKFQVEVKKRCELEEEVIRTKEMHLQKLNEVSKEAVRRAVSTSFELIQERYYLVSKSSISLEEAFKARLDKSDNILGKTPLQQDSSD